MIKRNGTALYWGNPKEVAINVYNATISKSIILRGVFYDTICDLYFIHKVTSKSFKRVEHLTRYSLVGVYNRDTTAKYIQDDIEAL